jgi:hypothetical protein
MRKMQVNNEVEASVMGMREKQVRGEAKVRHG